MIAIAGYCLLLFFNSLYWGTFCGGIFGKPSPFKINLPLPMYLFSGLLLLGLPTVVSTVRLLDVMGSYLGVISLVVGVVGFVIGLGVGLKNYGIR